MLTDYPIENCVPISKLLRTSLTGTIGSKLGIVIAKYKTKGLCFFYSTHIAACYVSDYLVKFPVIFGLPI